jgi:hypothetical protein
MEDDQCREVTPQGAGFVQTRYGVEAESRSIVDNLSPPFDRALYIATNRSHTSLRDRVLARYDLRRASHQVNVQTSYLVAWETQDKLVHSAECIGAVENIA